MELRPIGIAVEVVRDEDGRFLQTVLAFQMEDERHRRIQTSMAYTQGLMLQLETNEQYRKMQPGLLTERFINGIVGLEKKEKNYVSEDNIEAITKAIVDNVPEAIEHVIKFENYSKRLDEDL